jgi:hypothetical protein
MKRLVFINTKYRKSPKLCFFSFLNLFIVLFGLLIVDIMANMAIFHIL